MAVGSVDYSVRFNKNVERKLIFEVLKALSRDLGLQDHRYLGMGALWFIDFWLAHRELGISDMVSIEYQPHAERVNFNRPLKCIRVEPGESTAVLTAMDLDFPMIAWMDHETTLWDGSVLDDLSILCAELPRKSIILATINAEVRSLKGQKDEEGNEVSPHDYLKGKLGQFVPDDVSDKDFTRRGYPELAGRIMLDACRHWTTTGSPPDVFVPMFNFRYADNAMMVTVGGAKIDDSDQGMLGEIMAGFDFLGGYQQYSIDVPSLTLKEKAAFDLLLPSDEDVELEFDLKQKERDAYRRFYKYYPVYGEISI